MLNQQSTVPTTFTAAVNHSIRTLHVPSFSPSKLIHLDATRQYLGDASLSESYLLDISRQAILSGHCEQKFIDGEVYHQIVWNNLYFVLSQSFDTLLLISRHDTSKVLPAHVQPQPNQFHVLYHAEDTEEYEQIIDEIVDCVDRDMQTHFADYADQTFDTFYSPTTTPSPSEQNHDPIGQMYACSASTNASPSPVECLSTECSHRGVSFHDIYLKPIMERLAKCEPTTRVTGEFVAEIVSSALTKGVKRQISKRTFSFLWNGYTVVMSKSLRTILDVAVAREGDVDVGDVVTVHPDVVSILAKQRPSLDYFEIQRVAQRAKQSGEFTTKKNDYRRQFVYAFEHYHIVFASNHCTIVEMQTL